MSDPFLARIEDHLHALVDSFPDRHVGGPGNEHATAYVETELRRQGWDISVASFGAVDADLGPARLTVGGADVTLAAGPYTLPGDVVAPLVAANSLAALEGLDVGGRIVLLHGDIARDQLLPRGFDFLEEPDHRRIYALLEDGGAAGVIGATGRGGGMGGGLYPYPLIEDGDFDIPNAYVTDETGRWLATFGGQEARLHIQSRRFPVHAQQLTARRGPVDAPRIVVMAHLDSKAGSPGAVDNATGVAALLSIAQRLAERDTPWRLEIVPFNGEDHYSVGGEHCFVADNEDRWGEIALAVNLDAIGARDASTAVSLYGCTRALTANVQAILARHAHVTMGDPWYESDHSIVAMRGRPAMALTSSTFRELCATVTHTERDTLAIVAAEPVAAAAAFVADLVARLPADAAGPVA